MISGLYLIPLKNLPLQEVDCDYHLWFDAVEVSWARKFFPLLQPPLAAEPLQPGHKVLHFPGGSCKKLIYDTKLSHLANYFFSLFFSCSNFIKLLGWTEKTVGKENNFLQIQDLSQSASKASSSVCTPTVLVLCAVPVFQQLPEEGCCHVLCLYQQKVFLLKSQSDLVYSDNIAWKVQLKYLWVSINIMLHL